MAKDKVPSTPALLALRAAKVPFEIHQYQYVDKGGTRVSAEGQEIGRASCRERV